MFSIAICEDEPLQIHALTALITEYGNARLDLDISVHAFASGGELLSDIEAGRVFDVFLFDILMPDLNGIELAKELRSQGEDAPLVFLTSSSDFALDAFGVNATQYILKPVKSDSLFPILDDIVTLRAKKKKESFLLIATPERKVKIPLSSIVCVESMRRTMQIYLSDGRKLVSKTIRVPFAEAASPLLRDPRFLYAHKSFILNMELVNELTNSSFVMKGGMEVPVPKYKYTDAKTKYFEYLSKNGVESVGS